MPPLQRSSIAAGRPGVALRWPPYAALGGWPPCSCAALLTCVFGLACSLVAISEHSRDLARFGARFRDLGPFLSSFDLVVCNQVCRLSTFAELIPSAWLCCLGSVLHPTSASNLCTRPIDPPRAMYNQLSTGL